MLNEEMEKRRQEIGRTLRRRSPLPPEDIRPHWMTEGIEETYEYWNRLAEIWDDLYASPKSDEAGGGNEQLAKWEIAMLSNFPKTDKVTTILDVGCGTGSFWVKILDRAPNAHITGIDLCPPMLDKVRHRFEDLSRFTLIEGSTVEIPFGEACFDFVISMLHIHFFSTEVKAKIYAKIFRALRTGGKYISRDLCQTQKQERGMLRFYDQFVSTLPGADVGTWNYKQTMSIATQQRLLSEAGFVEIEPWIVDLLPSGAGSVFVAKKP